MKAHGYIDDGYIVTLTCPVCGTFCKHGKQEIEKDGDDWNKTETIKLKCGHKFKVLEYQNYIEVEEMK